VVVHSEPNGDSKLRIQSGHGIQPNPMAQERTRSSRMIVLGN